MRRVELNARLREAIGAAQYDPRDAIEVLVDIIRELNDEIEEMKRGI